MIPKDFIVLFNTLRHLKAKQVVYRLRYSLESKRGKLPLCSFSVTSNIAEQRRPNYKGPFLTYKFWEPEEINKGTYTFLNKTKNYKRNIDWGDIWAGRLWLYNLHYFQYLHCRERMEVGTAINLINDWIGHNPPGTPDAWDPFPISLRIVNWLKYVSEVAIPEDDLKRILESVYQQTLWLEKSMEYHLLANHLFKNIKALIFAGLFFNGSDAKRWLGNGLRLFREQLGEQILEDGGHFERSPMYHSMILEDCLDLLNIFVCRSASVFQELSAELKIICKKMLEFVLAMSHPDGNIALFNDAAFNIEPSPGDLKDYYEKIAGQALDYNEHTIVRFHETGYFIMSPGNGNKLIIDCGNIGPDYQPGHSHCDTLSFELSLKGERVIVDSGCHEYEPGKMRDYNRGNAGHNTVTVDGENQSEVWAVHRCGRRARSLYARLREERGDALVFEGAHDGYRRLPGHPIHHRRVLWDKGEIVVEDKVDGSGRHSIKSQFHINPECSVKIDDNKAVVTRDGRKIMAISPWKSGNLEIEKGWYCPEFGMKKTCPVIKVKHRDVELPFKDECTFQIFN